MSINYSNGHPSADYSMHEVAGRVFEHCNNNYAKAYAKAMRDVSPYDYEAIHAQVLYMLNNMSHWRGDIAKECRAQCKAWIAAYTSKMPR